MSNPTPNDVNRVISQLEQLSTPQPSARQLAQRLIAERKERQHAEATAYDFGYASKELKQVVYDAAVRFSRRRWWSRLFR